MRKNFIKSCAIAQDPASAVKNGICVLHGFGASVKVDGQHLLCRDGIADERRELKLSRATCGLKRLVIIGHSGSITLDALRWLYKLDIGITVIDTDGNVLLASIPAGADYPHLRRAQALAKDTELGTSIIRELLHAKIKGQAQTLQIIGPDETERIMQYLPSLNDVHDAPALRLIEAQAAIIYWKCWEGISTGFTRQDNKRVPSHWLHFGVRSSPISSSPRKAATPGNALLNYLYAILARIMHEMRKRSTLCRIR